MNQLLLINYHYIHDPARWAHPGIHPLDEAGFEAQLVRLKSRLHAATPAEVEAFADGRLRFERPAFFLTFDDGMAEHGTTVPAILERHGLKAVFFVISRPYLEQRPATVHKVHWLRANTPPDAFRENFLDRLPPEWREREQDPEIQQAASSTNRYDPPATARLKYMINFLLPFDLLDAVTAAMLEERGRPEAMFCRDFYMPEESITALDEAGHVVGCHSHAHRPLSTLETDALDQDLGTCNRWIETLTGRRPDWLSYPWGSAWSIPDNAAALRERHGYRLGLTLNRDWNRGGEETMRLNRVNTNEVDAMLESLEVSA